MPVHPGYGTPLNRLQFVLQDARDEFDDPDMRRIFRNAMNMCNQIKNILDDKESPEFSKKISNFIRYLSIYKNFWLSEPQQQELKDHGIFDELIDALNGAIQYLKQQSGYMNMDGGRRRRRRKGRKSRKINRRKSRKNRKTRVR